MRIRGGFQYSVGDAEIVPHSVPHVTEPFFQYSVGDAVVDVPGEDEGVGLLSILRWRCPWIIALLIVAALWYTFQYSVGDAAAIMQ